MTDLTIYRMPDVAVGTDETYIVYILAVNGVSIIKSNGIYPSNAIPELEWPKDLVTTALNLEKALGVRVQYRDARVLRRKYPGVSVAIPIRRQ